VFQQDAVLAVINFEVLLDARNVRAIFAECLDGDFQRNSFCLIVS